MRKIANISAFLLVMVAFAMFAQNAMAEPVIVEEVHNAQEEVIGGDVDEHGCIATAGYVWCEPKQRCIRPWEEECEAGNGASADTLKNRAEELCDEEDVAAVFVCGEYLQVVSGLEGAGSTYYKPDEAGFLGDGFQCPVIAPDAMSERCKQLVVGQTECVAIECPDIRQTLLEEKAGEFCNGEDVAAVFVCGEYVRVVSSLMGGGSTFYRFVLSDAGGSIEGEGIQCPVIALDAMSEQCRQLTMGLNCVETRIC